MSLLEALWDKVKFGDNLRLPWYLSASLGSWEGHSPALRPLGTWDVLGSSRTSCKAEACHCACSPRQLKDGWMENWLTSDWWQSVSHHQSLKLVISSWFYRKPLEKLLAGAWAVITGQGNVLEANLGPGIWGIKLVPARKLSRIHKGCDNWGKRKDINAGW